MRICLIASGYPSKSKMVRNIFISLQAKAMVKQGLSVHVITVGDNSTPKEEIEDGVHVHRVMNLDFKPTRLSPLFFVIRVLIKTIQLNNGKRIDVIHSHFADNAGLAGAITSRILRKPFVITVHGYDILVGKEFDYGYCLIWLQQLLVQFALNIADRIVAVSDALKRRLKELGVNPQKISLIRNGINPDFIKRKYKKKTSNQILTVSNLFRRKNIDYMLDAMPYILKRIPSVKYTIIGDGPDRNRLEKKVKERKLTKSVKFTGEVTKEILQRYYSNTDVFVLPSMYEAFGIVKLEALAFEVPVVTTSGWGSPEGIVHGETGFIVPLNEPKKMAEAILKILLNPDLRDEMGRRGKETVLKYYTWENNVKKHIELYNSLLKSDWL